MSMALTVTATELPGVLILQPQRHADARGFFMESFNQRDFQAATGSTAVFVQDNHSRSAPGVLRGLHYQRQHPQGKLVRVVQGAVFDVVVDLRRSSPTFKRWIGVELSADNGRQLWIPPGFAHGFLALADGADMLYKTTDYRVAGDEYALRWDDPAVAIAWPLQSPPLLSDKDAQAPGLDPACCFD